MIETNKDSSKEPNPFELLILLKAVEKDLKTSLPKAQEAAIKYHSSLIKGTDKSPTGKVAEVKGATITISTVKIPPVLPESLKTAAARITEIKQGLKAVNAPKIKELEEQLKALQTNAEIIGLQKSFDDQVAKIECGFKPQIAVSLPK